MNFYQCSNIVLQTKIFRLQLSLFKIEIEAAKMIPLISYSSSSAAFGFADCLRRRGECLL